MEQQLLAEIQEANLTYLILAQKMLREDSLTALFRLGLSEESANLLIGLTPAQLYKIACNNLLLCKLRVDDDVVWSLLSNQSNNKVDNTATTKIHAQILMAGKFSETM